MDINKFNSSDSIAWCPGCGNFSILNSLKQAFIELNLPPKDILIVSGIGQAAKLPHYIKTNCFNGLHGRALPVAASAKMVNPRMNVIVTTGDGDCYGEGGNHLIHNIRRNLNITLIVHNNQIYGLTKGQASPTTDIGYVTKVQNNGVILEPFHSMEFAIALGCGFVARGFSGEKDHLVYLMKEAINYNGFSLLEILQPCVSFNKKNTFKWYSERIYNINDNNNYDFTDKVKAFNEALKFGDQIPVGIFYNVKKETYEEKSGLNKKNPVIEDNIENINLEKILDNFT